MISKKWKAAIAKWKKNDSIEPISWWGVCALLGFLFLRSLQLSVKYSLLDVTVSLTILAISSYAIRHIQNYFHATSVLTLQNVAFTGAFCVLNLLSFHYIGNYVFPKEEWMKISGKTEYIIRGIISFQLLFLVLYHHWTIKSKSSQEKNTQQLLEVERQLNKAELRNIQQQFQPHFLFNSLNSISALTVIDPEEARRMVHLLADYLRGTLSKEHEQFVYLSEEINYLNLYLEIEKVRFGHRLQVEIQIDPLCKEAKLPTFILQPLVENAIKFGLYGNTGELTIRIVAQCSSGLLELAISNPYDPETVNASKGIGFGITSIQKKLYLLYGQQELIKIERKTTQFTTLLKIPQL